MRGRTLRALLTVALLCGTLTLLACPLGRLRVQILDYETASVRGLRLFRVDDATGALTGAGHIEFLALEKSADGEHLKYMQYDANGAPYVGPLYTQVERAVDQPAAIQITVALANPLPSGWFKVASYNPYGTSPTSAGQSFVLGSEG
jgi:hypothetical protein